VENIFSDSISTRQSLMPTASAFSIFLRFLQTIFTPEAVRLITVPVCLSKTIRISLNALNASNEVCYIRQIIF